MSAPRPLRHFAERHPGWTYELTAIGLIAVYVNAFAAWQALNALLGRGQVNAIPIVLAALLGAIVLAGAIRRRRRQEPVTWWALVTGGALAAVAFGIADPTFPAKQAHVPEYLLMAFVVHRALRVHVGGAALLVATAGATAVLGSHDEFLQGLSPSRTFGIRDIEVNAIAGVGGAFIASALEGSRSTAKGDGGLAPSEWVALGVLLVGWICLFLATYEFRGAVMPVWPLAPLVAGGFAWSVAGGSGAPARGAHHAATLIAGLMLATALYPLTAHAFSLVFH